MEIPNHVKDGRNFNFTIFNNEIIDNYNLSGNEFFVYCYLLRRTQSKGSCFPSYDTACKDLQLSRATFSECIKKLNKVGLITIMHTKTLKGIMNVYYINEISKDSSKIELSNGGVVQKLNLGVVQNLDCNNINLYKNINNKNYYPFLEFWNSKGIIKHKSLSKKSITLLNNLLKENSELEIKQAISNYVEIVQNSDFWFNYKWTFEEFLQRGFAKFNIDINILKQNFATNKKTNNEKKICVDYCGTDTRKIYYE